MARNPIVVIGAGIGGMSAAIRLAAAGYQVRILEQNASVGGKMNEIRQDGFRWDTGPSVLTMRPVFDQLFAAAGRRLEDYLDMGRVEPLTRYFFCDGACIDASHNLEFMAAQIERLDRRDVEGYLSFLEYAARLHRITGPVFIYDRPPTLRSLLRVPPWDALRVDPWFTMDQAIRQRVRSRHLRQLLARFATYVGASPYLAPATLSVIAHVELTGGIWYPRGGVYALATAFARLAKELGVEIQTGKPVVAIDVSGNAITGIRLAGGGYLPAEIVIANVDVTTVYGHLLPPTIAQHSFRRLREQPTSCSGFVLLLGIDGMHPQLAHHNIFFADDYRREFEDIFRQGIPPQAPTVYVAITAKSDPGHAPKNSENWFVLVNAPPLGASFNWHSQSAAYRSVVFATLERFGIDIRSRIRTEIQLTPEDIQRLTGAWRGALYGISSNRARDAFRRPHNRCPEVKGLYFAGGTTHPGGGVPMVTLSGKVAAELVMADGW